MLLSDKKVIRHLDGTLEKICIYSHKDECRDPGMPYRAVDIPVKSGVLTGYIGYTDQIYSPKASSKRMLINGKVYAMRKYMGNRAMREYLINLYGDRAGLITELEEPLPDTSDTFDFSYAFRGGENLDHIPDLYTDKGTNFIGMFLENRLMSLHPRMNTMNGINFSNMLGECNSLVRMDIDTSNAMDISGICIHCRGLVEITPSLKTEKVKKFARAFDGCISLTHLPPISLQSITYENVVHDGDMRDMLFNCNSLAQIEFKDVPIGIKEDDLRTATNAPGSCRIIINYRPVIAYDPVKSLSVANNELIEIDYSANDIILDRVGNAPLSSYIKQKQYWGTIYSDNDNDISNPLRFGCFITPENQIYMGNAYENLVSTEVRGRYGVTSFANGNLELLALDNSQDDSLQCIQIKNMEAGEYILSYETTDNFSLVGLRDSGASGFDILVDTPTRKAYQFHLDGTAPYIVFLTKDAHLHMQGFTTTLNKIMIVKSHDELPYLPVGIKVPSTSLILKKKDNSNFTTNSIVARGIEFLRNLTYGLFADRGGLGGLTCQIQNNIGEVSLAFNTQNVCIPKQANMVDVGDCLTRNEFYISPETHGNHSMLRNLFIYDKIMNKDELRKAIG